MEKVRPGSSTKSCDLVNRGMGITAENLYMRTYTCDQCGKVCSTKAAVIKHTCTHTGKAGLTSDHHGTVLACEADFKSPKPTYCGVESEASNRVDLNIKVEDIEVKEEPLEVEQEVEECIGDARWGENRVLPCFSSPNTASEAKKQQPEVERDEDLENFLYYSMMGSSLKIKPGVTPHKFDSQVKATRQNENRKRLWRKRLVHEILSEKENMTKCGSGPSSQAGSVKTINGRDTEGQGAVCEDHPIPGSLAPSTKAIERQTTKRSKSVQVVPMTADVACNTDSHQLEIHKSEQTHDASASSSDYSDHEFDQSKDFVPPENASVHEDDGNIKKLTLYTTRKIIMKNPMGYVGLHKEHFYILNQLCDYVSYNERDQSITTRDAIMIVLIAIRTGMPHYIIADMFGVNVSCVSHVLARLIPAMAEYLKELVHWPSSDFIRRRVPHSFKAFHHNVESIIDCFEIQIEKPSSDMTDMTQSSRVKYLISVTPDGLINFISSGKPGSCSDMELLRGSGYLECLRQGTAVLSDCGFNGIEAELATKGCHLLHPTSLSKDEQLPARNVLDMKIIAGLRIPVERVIQQIRVYKLLDIHSCIPLSMADLMDSIVYIACGLVNVHDGICKE